MSIFITYRDYTKAWKLVHAFHYIPEHVQCSTLNTKRVRPSPNHTVRLTWRLSGLNTFSLIVCEYYN